MFRRYFFILFSLVFLFQTATANTFLEDLDNCNFSKKMYSNCENCGYKPQDKLMAPSAKIHFWSINFAGIDLMIPVDDYKKILVLPSDEKDLFSDLVIEGDSYTVKIHNYYDFDSKHYRLLELGMTGKASQVNCYSLRVKERTEELRGIGLREFLFTGKPIYLSQLHESLEGWLFISGRELLSHGRKSQEATWSTVYRPINEQFVGYELKRMGENDPLQLGGLLSQSRETLKLAAEPPPNWLLEIESALQGSFSEAKTLAVSALVNEGFSKVDTGSLSMIVLER